VGPSGQGPGHIGLAVQGHPVLFLKKFDLICNVFHPDTSLTDWVRTGHGKPGKSRNLLFQKSMNLSEGHGKSWKAICFLRIKKDKKQAFYPLFTQAGILSIIMLGNI